MSSHKNLSGEEVTNSSTWRELFAVFYGLQVFKPVFKGKKVTWFVDNYGASVIIQKGSGKLDLHSLALGIFELTQTGCIDLQVTWIPREYNTTADLLSKYVDVGDWEIAGTLFSLLNAKWGPFTVDRFANSRNKKVDRFYSKFFEIGSEGVDAFAFNWETENNSLVPPVSAISKVIGKILTEHVTGTLIFPYWPSAEFWPPVRRGETWEHFITSVMLLEHGKQWLRQGSCFFSLLGSEHFHSSLVALRIKS